MSAFTKLTSVQTKRTLREPVAVFLMLALGPMLVLVTGAVFGSDADLVNFTAIVVAIVGLIIVPVDIVTQRNNGSLRRFRATPLPPLTYIAADVLVRFVISLASIAVMLAIAVFAFDSEHAGSMLSMVLAGALGVLAFLAVGYALAAIIRSPGIAQTVGNVLVFPLIFLSGAAVPLAAMPDGPRHIAQFSPLTQLVLLLDHLRVGQSWAENWVPVAVLLGLLVTATATAARYFRWE